LKSGTNFWNSIKNTSWVYEKHFWYIERFLIFDYLGMKKASMKETNSSIRPNPFLFWILKCEFYFTKNVLWSLMCNVQCIVQCTFCPYSILFRKRSWIHYYDQAPYDSHIPILNCVNSRNTYYVHIAICFRPQKAITNKKRPSEKVLFSFLKMWKFSRNTWWPFFLSQEKGAEREQRIHRTIQIRKAFHYWKKHSVLLLTHFSPQLKYFPH